MGYEVELPETAPPFDVQQRPGPSAAAPRVHHAARNRVIIRVGGLQDVHDKI